MIAVTLIRPVFAETQGRAKPTKDLRVHQEICPPKYLFSAGRLRGDSLCREQAKPKQAGLYYFAAKFCPSRKVSLSGVECSRGFIGPGLARALRCLLGVCGVNVRVSARGQEFVPANEQAAVNHLFEATLKTGDGLKCDLQHLKPELDFAFRFDIHYILGLWPLAIPARLGAVAHVED